MVWESAEDRHKKGVKGKGRNQSALFIANDKLRFPTPHPSLPLGCCEARFVLMAQSGAVARLNPPPPPPPFLPPPQAKSLEVEQDISES